MGVNLWFVLLVVISYGGVGMGVDVIWGLFNGGIWRWIIVGSGGKVDNDRFWGGDGKFEGDGIRVVFVGCLYFWKYGF